MFRDGESAGGASDARQVRRRCAHARSSDRVAPMSAELIERFYAAFNRRDGDAMAACYAPNATFVDPAFGRLDAEQTKAMWQMLTSQADDLTVELVEHESDGTTG